MNKTIKYVLITLSYLLSVIALQAQTNLVPNHSFENITDCNLNSNGDINKAVPWFIPPPLGASPDLFNSCAPPPPYYPSYSIPTNWVGWKVAHSGNGYAGIATYLQNGYNAREYIECKLKQPLRAGITYCAGFFVSLADSSNCAISLMGMYFSEDTARTLSCINMPPCSLLISDTPQIENDTNQILSDTAHWVEISGEYIAQGGEQFITIGNFFNDTVTQRHLQQVTNSPNSFLAYYYIDDVFVYACDSADSGTSSKADTFSLFVPNVFTPNSDGINDAFTVKAQAVSFLHLQVYNRWGALLFEQKWQAADTTKAGSAARISWDGRTTSGNPCSAGTYYYLLTYTKSKDDVTGEKKGAFTLLR